ncbi:kinase-like domain-containing protein [Talaromyces proteolyticus]|uniref:non-specific serine/threonine protein kinase n=1 Tax=Talaromyces proteolyticus TaxID=1131652 RepID=A0AAD4KFN4_9EURO|nr:kinase-like domain-containing protein [Talaromyces proteolyticus]KAH8689916.1 kinase-like domain-containing protein [Talaromyces proteolyticus]
MDPILYVSTIDAEPLHRYREGGYHPVALGHILKEGSYKILHKLGWGGYSTVWAARDQRLDETYVAIKFSVSESENDRGNREVRVMKKLASIHPSPQHVMCILDDFELEGPNGTHKCLVFELLGPSVTDVTDAHFPDGRLPGKLAKSVAKQAFIGLDTLHQQKIGHGDLHTRNLAFTMPCLDDLPEGEYPGVPEYIVRHAVYRLHPWSSLSNIKIVDFGESLLQSAVPQTLHTPLPVRAPEIIFKDHLDYRVDLWSMGCMLFELFVGQPPFDSFLITPTILVGQIREMASDTLPARWMDSPDILDGTFTADVSGEDLTKEGVVKLGQIIGRLMDLSLLLGEFSEIA